VRLSIWNITRDVELATNVQVADDPWLRMRGLLGRRSLLPGDGLMLRPCRQVHTLGMCFPIDVVYLGSATAEGTPVLHAVPALCPWRLGPFLRRACAVLELQAGAVECGNVRSGDLLGLIDVL